MTHRPPAPITERRHNVASQSLSDARLNGQVYTPDDLAAHVVASLDLRSGMSVLDPACGDGVWLRAVAARAAREGITDLHLEGWDVDASALEVARQRQPEGVAWLHRDGLADCEARFDRVVGNPPYLEAKRMPDAVKAWVKQRAPHAARGAFDLYGAFVERSVALLRPGGTAALVVPNRVLVTAYAAALRHWLLERVAIDVVDLSRDLPFLGKAAVYPIVLSCTAGQQGYTVRHGDGPVRLPLDAVRGPLDGMLPLPEPGVPGQLLARVLGDRACQPLQAHAEVRWTVSFHKAGLRDRYVFATQPATPHARRFLGGGTYQGNREVGVGQIAWSGGWIDYDVARARQDGNALPDVSLFDDPKLVVCQNARRARCAVDLEGFVLKDTFLAVRAHEAPERWLPWLALVLHSDVGHTLYEQLFGGTRKGGGYLHFLGRLLLAFPVPVVPPGVDVQALYDGGAATRSQAERVVRAAYGVTAAEHAWLDATAFPPH